jgi:hypothetical protein
MVPPRPESKSPTIVAQAQPPANQKIEKALPAPETTSPAAGAKKTDLSGSLCVIHEPSCTSSCDWNGCPYPPGCVWVDAEFLLWWTKGVHLPPLLTTSPPGTPASIGGTPTAGVIGQDSTTVVFGNETVNNAVRPGARFTVGAWLEDSHTTGVEANFFFLASRTTNFNASSTGSPILARPFVIEDPTDPNFGKNGALFVAFPGLLQGSFQARVDSHLIGTDVYLRQALCCGCCCRVDGLLGFRYLHLREGLGISETEISTVPTNPLFGIPFVINEGFDTENNFYGGEIGLIGEMQRGCWFIRGVAKVALGCTERSVRINGTTQVDSQPLETGGFLALPSNIGDHNSSRFSVVPEVGINVGYNITPCLRVYTGYTFLYWTGVARPGDQVDARVNATQQPLGNGLVGAPLPAFPQHSSGYWAQGINFGLEYRF